MISGLIYTFIFVASFLLVISALVFFHELGHYSVARFFKVAVERFSIGFGKPIVEWTAKSGVKWSINRYPLGGYVKFVGDAGATSNPDQAKLAEIEMDLAQTESDIKIEDCFHFKPLWQRTLVVLAGPVANFILAVVIFAGLALAVGTRDIKSVVLEVMPNSAASEAGVLPGDRFLRFDGKDVQLADQLIGYVALRSNVEIQATVDRDGQEVSFPITPKRQIREDFIGGESNIGTIGVRIGGPDSRIIRKYGPLESVFHGVDEVGNTIALTGRYIGRIFTGQEDGKALGGIARIATMTGKTAVDTAKMEVPIFDRLKYMALNLLYLSAALSIGLGVANLMPIPVLDGGHLLYYGYEAVAGRPLDEKKQEFGFRIGFAVLISLMLVLTFNDIEYIRSLFS